MFAVNPSAMMTRQKLPYLWSVLKSSTITMLKSVTEHADSYLGSRYAEGKADCGGEDQGEGHVDAEKSESEESRREVCVG